MLLFMMCYTNGKKRLGVGCQSVCDCLANQVFLVLPGNDDLFFWVVRIKNRKASFTDPESGNISATSVSKRTVIPKKLFRSEPTFLTFKLIKSYSGLSSSSIFTLSFFIIFLFPPSSFSCTD